jgi:hypothetical protein
LLPPYAKENSTIKPEKVNMRIHLSQGFIILGKKGKKGHSQKKRGDYAKREEENTIVI